MRTIYLDSNYRCYTAPAEGRTATETDAFDDGKCTAYIEGYRLVPEGETWVREDGVVFAGEMLAPWQDSRILEAAQAGYEAAMAEIEALTIPPTDPEFWKEVSTNG